MRIFICLVVWMLVLEVSISQAPKFSNDFLNIGIGGRGMAMAGAVSANTSSIQAAYWNPAGLPYNPSKFQVSAQHAEWFSGIGNYDYVAFGKSFSDDFSNYGSLTLIRMAIDKIPNTLRLRGPDGSIDYSKIEEFSVADYAMLLSFGKKIGDGKWAFGVNGKVIHRNFGAFANSWGFGFDAGIRYHSKNFAFAIMGRDITTTFNAYKFNFSTEEKAILQQTNNSIPISSVEYNLPKVIIALSYKVTVTSKFSLLSALDLECSSNGTESAILATNKFAVDPKVGVELDYANRVFVRFGFGNFQNVVKDITTDQRELSFNPSAGLGIQFGKITIDYAMTNIANSGVGLYSHFLSLNLDF
ncbi:MAG: hypothetical protein IPM92_05365 [Saprospiraceae bacterium]|nr:hypothetical protein [Saprospiraceae bacterium]